MRKVRGIYDGERVRPLEPLLLPANTEVEIVDPEDGADSEPDAAAEDAHWQRLIDAGLIKERPHPEDLDETFEPIPIPGEPIAETIIRERR
jgi:hypothetical protein